MCEAVFLYINISIYRCLVSVHQWGDVWRPRGHRQQPGPGWVVYRGHTALVTWNIEILILRHTIKIQGLNIVVFIRIKHCHLCVWNVNLHLYVVIHKSKLYTPILGTPIVLHVADTFTCSLRYNSMSITTKYCECWHLRTSGIGHISLEERKFKCYEKVKFGENYSWF